MASLGGGDGLNGVDLGCGAGRHAKLLLEHGFNVRAVDIDYNNIQDTLALIGENKNLSVEVADFLQMEDKEVYDVAIAWNFLYAYNKKWDDLLKRLSIIHRMLRPKGKIITTLRTDKDGIRQMFEPDDNGIVYNRLYKDSLGYIFLSREEMVGLFEKSGFTIEYFEVFSRNHTMNWKSINGNDAWRDSQLDVYEEWYAVLATKE